MAGNTKSNWDLKIEGCRTGGKPSLEVRYFVSVFHGTRWRVRIPAGGNHERENRISGFPSLSGHFSRNSAPHPGAGGHQHRSVRRPVLEAVRCAGRPHQGGGAAVLHAERVPDALAGGDAAVCSVLPQKPAQDWHSPGSVEPHLLRGESPDVW